MSGTGPHHVPSHALRREVYTAGDAEANVCENSSGLSMTCLLQAGVVNAGEVQSLQKAEVDLQEPGQHSSPAL